MKIRLIFTMFEASLWHLCGQFVASVWHVHAHNLIMNPSQLFWRLNENVRVDNFHVFTLLPV